MGTWGAGIYSNDFAEDFRATIKAVSRLPYKTKRLVEILCETAPDIANDPADEDHTTFWLVLADQFHKRGIPSRDVFSRAKKIVDSGIDLDMQAELGMGPTDLKNRKKKLNELRTKIAAPCPEKKRSTLKAPQPLVMNPGDLYAYPVDKQGECINPYMARHPDLDDWKHKGWGAALIVEAGHAFDFLAWYRPLKLVKPLFLKKCPGLDELLKASSWQLDSPGTCTSAHFKHMKLDKLGELKVSKSKLKKTFGKVPGGNDFAIHDISISNNLNAEADHTEKMIKSPTLVTLSR